jgi:hypothetical protein
MTWNRAKYFEVFGMACSGLGGFMFSSVVSIDFGIHFPFHVLCSQIILLRHTFGFESNLYGIVSVQIICEHKIWKFYVWRCSRLGKAYVCPLWVPPNRSSVIIFVKTGRH